MTEEVKTRKRTMAIMTDVKIGYSDDGVCGMSFTAHISEGSASRQFLDWPTTNEVLAAYKVRDSKDLEGRPCWMYSDDEWAFGPGCIAKWEGPCVIK